MFSEAFKGLALLGLVSAVVSTVTTKEVLYSMIIQSPLNDSLCVRTVASEWEGAQMTLADCERTYQFYDGEKRHLVEQVEGIDGLKIHTVWAPAPTAFGIPGCFYPLGGRVRAVSCYDNVPQEFWNILVWNAEQSLYIVQSRSTGKCMGVPEAKDGVAVVEVDCAANDLLHQWKFVKSNEN